MSAESEDEIAVLRRQLRALKAERDELLDQVRRQAAQRGELPTLSPKLRTKGISE